MTNPQKKRKLKILVVPANQGGCAYYRAISPMTKLAQLYPDDVEVLFDLNPLGKKEDGSEWLPDWTFENLHWADVVMVNNISNFGGPYTARVVGKAKEFGKFVHFDTDDLLTELYEEHRLIEVYRDNGLSDITKFIYSNSDLVTVTQSKFADRISEYCTSMLGVIKNAIDYDLPAWNHPKRKSKKVHVGWAGGIHHDPDVKEFASVPNLVNQKVGREKVWWDFYGHPPKGPNGLKDWQWDVWAGYRATILKGFKGPANFTIHQAMPPDTYGAMYSQMDLAIAPLKMNFFNDSKSEIKVAECVAYGIPLVASDVGCYNETIINGETGYLMKPGASPLEWMRILSKVIKDNKHRQEMGKTLRERCESLFNLNKVVGDRITLYEDCFKVKGDPRD